MRLCLHIGKRLCNLNSGLCQKFTQQARMVRSTEQELIMKLDVFNQWAQTLLRERESTEQLAVELFNHEEGYKHN